LVQGGFLLSRLAKASILLMLVILVSGAVAPGQPERTPGDEDLPQLHIDSSVAADFRALALQTWDQFLKVFWARRDCFGDVHLRADKTLGDRAVYEPDTATVSVRVPATAAMLQGALVHEWAHHLEFQCTAQEQLRKAFLLAQGLPEGTPWRSIETPEMPAGDWAEVPSEQYAEATIALVLGGRSIPTGARVTAQAVDVIERWAAGDLPLSFDQSP
jgi:hypothetical protein